jgi:hypothetical protein
MVYKYFNNIFIAVDQLANTVIGGDPDETISSRIGKCQRGDHGKLISILIIPIAILINILFIWQGTLNHCIRSIEEDEGSKDLILK